MVLGNSCPKEKIPPLQGGHDNFGEGEEDEEGSLCYATHHGLYGLQRNLGLVEHEADGSAGGRTHHKGGAHAEQQHARCREPVDHIKSAS